MFHVWRSCSCWMNSKIYQRYSSIGTDSFILCCLKYWIIQLSRHQGHKDIDILVNVCLKQIKEPEQPGNMERPGMPSHFPPGPATGRTECLCWSHPRWSHSDSPGSGRQSGVIKEDRATPQTVDVMEEQLAAEAWLVVLQHFSHQKLLPCQCNSQRSCNQPVLSIRLIKLINPPANHRLTSISTNTNKWIKCFSRGGKLTTLILGTQQFLSTNAWHIISKKKRFAIRFIFSMHVSGNAINHVCKMLQGSSN